MSTLFPAGAAAQTDKQIWGELTLDWIKSHTLTLGVDIEPKALVAKQPDEPGWATLDVTPSAEYTRGRWFDAVGELHVGRTRQSDEQDSTEVTPRIGFRFHLLSNLADDLRKERQPRRRLVLRNFARVEWHNLYYSDNTPSSSTIRYRNRFETEFPFNRPRVTDDGVLYESADVEWFWMHQDVSERFANKQRIRAGVGYRRSYAWRVEVLYIWDRSRDSAGSVIQPLEVHRWHGPNRGSMARRSTARLFTLSADRWGGSGDGVVVVASSVEQSIPSRHATRAVRERCRRPVCHGKPIGEVDRPGTIRLVAVGSRRRHVVALSSSDPAQRPYVLTVARDEV